jgi:hypothetical protein
VSKHVHPCTISAALEVADNLRPDDRRELVEGHGHDPKEALLQASSWGSTVHFTVPDGRIAGLAGVHSNGAVWMLCTEAVEDFPHTFAREAKRFIDSREEPLLWNIVDKRNTIHLKLLKFLGFKFLREVNHGPNNLTFIEFCRVRPDNRRGIPVCDGSC